MANTCTFCFCFFVDVSRLFVLFSRPHVPNAGRQMHSMIGCQLPFMKDRTLRVTCSVCIGGPPTRVVSPLNTSKEATLKRRTHLACHRRASDLTPCKAGNFMAISWQFHPAFQRIGADRCMPSVAEEPATWRKWPAHPAPGSLGDRRRARQEPPRWPVLRWVTQLTSSKAPFPDNLPSLSDGTSPFWCIYALGKWCLEETWQFSHNMQAGAFLLYSEQQLPKMNTRSILARKLEGWQTIHTSVQWKQHGLSHLSAISKLEHLLFCQASNDTSKCTDSNFGRCCSLESAACQHCLQRPGNWHERATQSYYLTALCLNLQEPFGCRI